jgi:hypothetical protein
VEVSVLTLARLVTVTPVLVGILGLAVAAPSRAEWYVAGYGGYSTGGTVRDVTMPDYGLSLAQSQFPTAAPPLNAATGDTLTQTFKTSNIDLSNSAVGGAKAGYFFKKEGFPWLGIEVDIFTTKPDIKSQTLTTRQDIVFSPGDTSGCPIIPNQCPQGINGQKGSLTLQTTSLRVTAFTANLIVRYPGKLLQPYVGIGGGGFYIRGSGQIDGQQFAPGFSAQFGLKALVAPEWGMFVEGKYNLANINNIDPTFGLSGMYSIFHVVAGVAYHF